MFLTIAVNSPLLRTLLTTPNIKLMNLARAEALPRIYPYVVRFIVPQGLFDWSNNIPATDVDIVATTLNVMVRKDLHPAIVSLLAQAMVEAHGRAGVFQQAGEFPTSNDPEYPMSEIARDYFRDGPSIWNRYLPFWMTNYAKRGLAIFVAILAVAIPLFNYTPRVVRWYYRGRLMRLYRLLRGIELQLHSELDETELKDLQQRVEAIDKETGRVELPNRVSDLFFSFKVHVNLVRTRLAARLARPEA